MAESSPPPRTADELRSAILLRYDSMSKRLKQIARYVLEPEGRACEFALVVADAWQGRGIGRRMMAKLIAVARARGLQRIYGDVLAMNRPMIEFCNRLGFALSRHPDDPTVTRATLQL